MTAAAAPLLAETDVLARLRRGPLGAAGGVAVAADVPDEHTTTRLADEAFRLCSAAERQESINVTGDDGRGATPSRLLANGGGGPVQDALYHQPQLHDWLSAQIGVAVRPTSARGTYSYYTRPGDYLDLHVDVVGCDVTLITVVHDDTPPVDPGGGLAVYGDHIGMRLSAVHAEHPHPTALIKAPVGHSVVILGGLLPHRVLPLGSTGARVISALCFEAVD